MPTLNIPAPTVTVTVDVDGTSHINGVDLTPSEAAQVADFLTVNQPGYVAPVPEVEATEVPA